ncbi:MAG: hypothetical protein GF355_06020 [Candidatus Eisenbacteria bacterium]|nr:hypothetical protein [Candidatus Eisenbacteria bacterium]
MLRNLALVGCLILPVANCSKEANLDPNVEKPLVLPETDHIKDRLPPWGPLEENDVIVFGELETRVEDVPPLVLVDQGFRLSGTSSPGSKTYSVVPRRDRGEWIIGWLPDYPYSKSEYLSGYIYRVCIWGSPIEREGWFPAISPKVIHVISWVYVGSPLDDIPRRPQTALSKLLELSGYEVDAGVWDLIQNARDSGASENELARAIWRLANLSLGHPKRRETCLRLFREARQMIKEGAAVDYAPEELIDWMLEEVEGR